MAHIKYGRTIAAINTSDEDYYPVAKQVGAHVNKRARRSDITAVVGKSAGMGAPACFIPSLAEVHINTEVCDLGAPDKVDWTDALWQWSHAPAVGAMDHEAAHARHTHFDPRELMDEYEATRKMVDVITTLEEPRIEYNAIRANPATKPFLRQCAMEIVGRDFVIPDSRYGAAAAAGLLLARVDAGVLSKTEARDFRSQIEGVLGVETLDLLEPLWQRFLRLHDRDYTGMVQVATEWLEALGEDPEDAEGMVAIILMGEPLPGDPGEGDEGSGEGEGEGEKSEDGEGSGKGEDGDEDGEGGGSGEGGEGEGESPAAGFGAIIMGGVREAETKMDGEAVEARAAERSERSMAERKADAERREAAEAPHAEAFKHSGVHGYTPGGFAHLTGTRQPTSEERRAAKALARSLEQIDYRDRAVRKVTSIVPPGRLRGRMAVAEAASKSKGLDFDGALWQGKRRVRVDSTPLTIGFAVDISGSMGSAMKPLASTQWVVSTAGAHIDAKVSSVHFGEHVYGVTPAGVREKEVRTFYPGDGSEAFRDAALALDKELNLLDGSGARLLFIASDGVFVVPSEQVYARTFMALAARKGVAVIFLDFTGSMSYGSYGAPVVKCEGLSPVDVAKVVGKAATDHMRKIDSRI
jgi:hypothetical protein